MGTEAVKTIWHSLWNVEPGDTRRTRPRGKRLMDSNFGTSGAVNPPAIETTLAMASPTMLLVDDDVTVLASLSKVLNYFGYVVAGASSSQAAMDYVVGTRNCFDVIITDLAMPGINGMELLTLAKKTFPDVPVIIITGHTEQCIINEALRLGAFAYLTKPLDFQGFANTIERALRSVVRIRR